MTQKRIEAIRNSQMHSDAQDILAAVQLDGMLQEFLNTYDDDETDRIFAAVGCSLPEDGGPDRDEQSSWSEWVYSDVVGCGWALGQFLNSLEMLVVSGETPGRFTMPARAECQAEDEPAAVVEGGGQ
jgi:hypothetical protein